MEGLKRGSFGRVLAAMAATGWLGLLARPAQAATLGYAKAFTPTERTPAKDG